MEHLISGLNEAQREAVTATNPAVLVLAGPGSGKTRVLTHRIAYLIHVRQVPPWRIMAVTFTNKAAREMRERTEVLLGDNLRGLVVGTFHSTCARILRREVADSLPHYTQDFVIFDSDDQKNAVKQAMSDLNIDEKRFNVNNMRSGISHAKNALIPADKYQANNYKGEIIARIYRRYQEILITNNAMDFDDLLMNTVILFDKNPLVREKYQQQFEHVLIDEFQDTNLTQYGIIRNFIGEGNEIFIVGDADQSIYKWRGADIRNLNRFRKEFPKALEIKLEQNYRSTQIILDAAMEVIKQNDNRVHKELFTEREGGDKITVWEAYNDLEESDMVVNTIQNLMLEGYSPGDCAVMYRTNAQSRSIEEAFLRAGIKYTLVGATRFYARREIKDLIAYLRLIHNPADEFSFRRVVNVPKRGVGAKTVNTLREWALHNGWQPAEAVMELAKDPALQHPFNGRALKPLRAFGAMLLRWTELSTTLPVVQLLETILEDTEYKAYIVDGTEEGDARWENVAEFGRVTTVAGEMPLASFLEEIALVSEVDDLEDERAAATLLTMHAAKGLEFPVVFIIGLEEGVLPHSRSLDSGDFEELAEERRLFYVGVTRAKDRLYLSYAFQRMSWGNLQAQTPSRFLDNIPGDLVIGGTARSRRSATKNRASSWSWGSESRGSSSSRSSSGRSSYTSTDSFDTPENDEGRFRSKSKRRVNRIETDHYKPKKRQASTGIPSMDALEKRSPTSGGRSRGGGNQ
ncbi:MAG: UvrD-helicase domain-containing protein, partial [Chloroflexota bacterium]